MDTADEAWLVLLLLAVFSVLLFLRNRYPNASKGAETAALLGATVLFFSICSLFLKDHKPVIPASVFREEDMLHRFRR
jgi:hypothetical protein